MACSTIKSLCLCCCAWLACTSLAAVPVEPDGIDRDYTSELRIPEPVPADASIDRMHVVPGFRVELVAAEPAVCDPVAATFDERGRLYAVQMSGYSEQGDQRLGSIVRLEDLNADGVFETRTLFAEKLSWPTAIACWKDGVIVAQAPDIVYYRDPDGDGRADQRQRVFSGFSRKNVQGMVNSFVWGIDGWLYGSSSTTGGSIQQLLHGARDPVELAGRDFVIDPRDWTLWSIAGGGQHGMSFDRWGERFVCSNSNHLQWIRFPRRHLARDAQLAAFSTTVSIAADGPAAEVFRRSPVEPWRIVRTRLRVKGIVRGPIEGGGRAAGYFTGATGVTIYSGDQFGQPFNTAFNTGTFAFVGDVGGNLVHCKQILPTALERTARRIHRGREFLASEDPWFRPVQLLNGPDGGLYVLDMYRAVIEHPLSLPPVIKRHLDLTQGRDRGRIYRVVAAERPASARIPPPNLAARQWVDLLGHANGWHRETASRLLLQDDVRGTTEALLSVGLPHPIAMTRVRSLYLLAAKSALEAMQLDRAVRDPDARVRQHAVRIAEQNLELAELEPILTQVVDDPDLNVRYQVALSLFALELGPRVDSWLKLARRDARHERMRVALISSSARIHAEAFVALLKDSQFHAAPGAEVLLLALAQRVGASRRPDQLKSVITELIGRPTPGADRMLRALLQASRLRGEALREMLRDCDLPVGTLDARLVAAARVARTDEATLEERREAVQWLALGNFGQAVDTWRHLLTPQQPADLQQAAIQQIQLFPDETAADLLLDQFPGLRPKQRRSAIDMLLTKTVWTRRMLQRIDAGQLMDQELTTVHRRKLLQHPDDTVRSRMRARFAVAGDRDRVYARYSPVLDRDGDVQAGQRVFQRVCANCHPLDGKRVPLGPDLKDARRKGAAYLLQNILDPNREVDPRYEAYTVVTHDGRIVTGLATQQTERALVLRTSEGNEERLMRDDMERLKSTGKSLMPEGLETDITPEQMADLLAYMAHGSDE